MVCDLPEKYESLKKDFEGNCHDLFEMEEVEGRRDIKVQPWKLTSDVTGTNIKVVPDGFHISRRCDWIMYAVEAEYIDSVVKKYGPGKFVGRQKWNKKN